jgi:hypothetical protein
MVIIILKNAEEIDAERLTHRKFKIKRSKGGKGLPPTIK